jgi:cell division septation protein DedD
VPPPSEEMMSDRTAPPAPPLPAKDTWKEVVSQNGDRSWIVVGPGTPPKEPTRQEAPSVFTGKDEQSHYEQIMPAVVAPPAIQPPPENWEEKVHMKNNGQSVRSIATGVQPDRVLNQQHLPARKNSEELAPVAPIKPAVILPATPLPIKQTEKGVSLQRKGQSRISADLRTLPQQPLAQRELPLLTEEAGARYSVQVGFFGDEKNALALTDKLRIRGYDAHLKKHMRADQKVFFRVLVGHFHEEKSAVELAGKIRKKEELNAIIFVQGK